MEYLENGGEKGKKNPGTFLSGISEGFVDAISFIFSPWPWNWADIYKIGKK